MKGTNKKKKKNIFCTAPPSCPFAELRRNLSLKKINTACLYGEQNMKEAFQYEFDKKRYSHSFLKLLNKCLATYFWSNDPIFLEYPESAKWEDVLKGFRKTFLVRWERVKARMNDWGTVAYVWNGREYNQVSRCTEEGDIYKVLSTNPDKVKKGTFSFDERRDSDLLQENSPLDKAVQQENNDLLYKVIGDLDAVDHIIVENWMKSKSERLSQTELGIEATKLTGRTKPYTQGFISQKEEALRERLKKRLKLHSEPLTSQISTIQQF